MKTQQQSLFTVEGKPIKPVSPEQRQKWIDEIRARLAKLDKEAEEND